MKFKLNFWTLIVVILLAFFVMGSVVEYKRIANLRVTGHLFGDTTWTGVRSWAKAGTVDTLVIAGLERTNCYMWFQADSLTCKAPLYLYDISSDGDTAFVKCDSSLTTDFDYYWMVIRK